MLVGCNSIEVDTTLGALVEDAPIKVVAMGWKMQGDDTDGEFNGISVVGSTIGIHGMLDRCCRKSITW